MNLAVDKHHWEFIEHTFCLLGMVDAGADHTVDGIGEQFLDYSLQFWPYD